MGKDLSRVCLPVYFNEPLSALQRIAEEMEYSELLDKVQRCNQQGVCITIGYCRTTSAQACGLPNLSLHFSLYPRAVIFRHAVS